MTQQDLFFLPAPPGAPTFPLGPASRSTDPSTSHEAERSHTESGERRHHSEIVLALLLEFPGSTYRELAAKHTGRVLRRGERPIEAVEFQRRLADLAPRDADGRPAPGALVERGPARACEISHKRAQTWWPIR